MSQICSAEIENRLLLEKGIYLEKSSKRQFFSSSTRRLNWNLIFPNPNILFNQELQNSVNSKCKSRRVSTTVENVHKKMDDIWHAELDDLQTNITNDRSKRFALTAIILGIVAFCSILFISKELVTYEVHKYTNTEQIHMDQFKIRVNSTFNDAISNVIDLSETVCDVHLTSSDNAIIRFLNIYLMRLETALFSLGKGVFPNDKTLIKSLLRVCIEAQTTETKSYKNQFCNAFVFSHFDISLLGLYQDLNKNIVLKIQLDVPIAKSITFTYSIFSIANVGFYNNQQKYSVNLPSEMFVYDAYKTGFEFEYNKCVGQVCPIDALIITNRSRCGYGILKNVPNTNCVISKVNEINICNIEKVGPGYLLSVKEALFIDHSVKIKGASELRNENILVNSGTCICRTAENHYAIELADLNYNSIVNYSADHQYEHIDDVSFNYTYPVMDFNVTEIGQIRQYDLIFWLTTINTFIIICFLATTIYRHVILHSSILRLITADDEKAERINRRQEPTLCPTKSHLDLLNTDTKSIC